MPDDHQHYVPQFLLRNFAAVGSKRNHKIWVFDKRNEKCFLAAISKIATQGNFYDFSLNGETLSLDPDLQRLESLVAGDFREILRQRAIPKSRETRARIALFAAVQMVRTKAHRQQFVDFTDLMLQEVEKRGGWAPGAPQACEFNAEESAAQWIQIIPDLAKTAAPLIMQKLWILYSTTTRDPFFIGDNPVTLDNSTYGADISGRLGLASTGIEVYLPLSNTLSMGFLCPSHEATIRAGVERFGDRLDSLPNWPSARAMIKAFDGEDPLAFDHQNVLRHNSMQVCYAEQYVFSHDDNFALIREMISTNPETKGGPRLTIV